MANDYLETLTFGNTEYDLHDKRYNGAYVISPYYEITTVRQLLDFVERETGVGLTMNFSNRNLIDMLGGDFDYPTSDNYADCINSSINVNSDFGISLLLFGCCRLLADNSRASMSLSERLNKLVNKSTKKVLVKTSDGKEFYTKITLTPYSTNPEYTTIDGHPYSTSTKLSLEIPTVFKLENCINIVNKNTYVFKGVENTVTKNSISNTLLFYNGGNPAYPYLINNSSCTFSEPEIEYNHSEYGLNDTLPFKIIIQNEQPVLPTFTLIGNDLYIGDR